MEVRRNILHNWDRRLVGIMVKGDRELISIWTLGNRLAGGVREVRVVGY